MKVLIACEFSGIVSDAFRKKGHDVTSCDLLPSERSGKHYIGDVRDILNNNWDLMIGHPPCQYLSYGGNDYLNEKKYGQKAIDRKILREESLQFFLTLWNAPIKRICLENPRGYPMRFVKSTQLIHPYYFGDNCKKRTLLWLKNLPPLFHTKINTLFENVSHVKEPEAVYMRLNWKGKQKPINRTEAIGGNTEKGKKERSRFFPMVANAMAEQWNNLD